MRERSTKTLANPEFIWAIIWMNSSKIIVELPLKWLSYPLWTYSAKKISNMIEDIRLLSRNIRNAKNSSIVIRQLIF